MALQGLIEENPVLPSEVVDKPSKVHYKLTFPIFPVDKFGKPRPHRLVAQDIGFSVREQGFDSPWGYFLTA
jgi:hypothetical protein